MSTLQMIHNDDFGGVALEGRLKRWAVSVANLTTLEILQFFF